MPAIMAMLMSFLGNLVFWLIAKVALFLGLSAVAVTGISVVTSWVKGYVETSLGAASGSFLNLVLLTKFDVAMGFILAGLAMRVALRFGSSGSATKFSLGK